MTSFMDLLSEEQREALEAAVDKAFDAPVLHPTDSVEIPQPKPQRPKRERPEALAPGQYDSMMPATKEPVKLKTGACSALTCKAECQQFVLATSDRGFKTCKCGHTDHAHTGGKVQPPVVRQVPPTPRMEVIVVDHVTEPEDLVLVTTINGVEVDLRSEALHVTKCADCPEVIEVEVAPKGVDLELLVSKPRTAVCLECGAKRLEGKQGTIVHQPVSAKLPATEEKEEQVFDLTKFSKAELAAMAVEARERMVAQAAAEVPEKRKKAKKKEAKRAAEDKALMREDRDARKGVILPAVTVKKKTVPALDLSEIGLDETLDGKQRSPYNKMLHALGEDLLDPETTTYRDVVKLHRTWVAVFGADEVIEPKKEGKKKGKRLVAQVEPDVQAKVEAFAKVTGQSIKKARKHLESAGVI